MAAIQDVARASLYRGAINLWVEDELTRAYLSAVWNTPTVAFFIGGGNEGVRAVVKDAEESGFTNVFALIDRDFRRTNKPHWFVAGKTGRTFVPPLHEIENYLLDAGALAASRFNNLKKTADEIESVMRVAAGRLLWWAARRDVVAELRRRFREGFLSDPNCDVSSDAQAHGHICSSPWFQKLAHECGRTTEAEVDQLLSTARALADQSLADGSWKLEFAGKEILRDVGIRICDRTKFPGYKPSAAEFDGDLAKEVGAWQRDNNAVPSDLTDLLVALQQRIASPPSRPGA